MKLKETIDPNHGSHGLARIQKPGPTSWVGMLLILGALGSLSSVHLQEYTFTTLAGSGGGPGEVDGTGRTARFSSPAGLAVDSASNVYVADGDNQAIRQVRPGGTVTTLAGAPTLTGSNDGTGSAAQFNYPSVTVVTNLTGTSSFTEPATGSQRRFYRLRQQ
jgi:hypothetical protein